MSPPKRTEGRDPEREKAADYARQRRGFAEYAHALRHGKWRRTKRRPAEHGLRGKVKARLAQALDADPTEADVGDLRREPIQRWGNASLREWVDTRRRRREAFGYNYFKRPYDPATHREPFLRALDFLAQGRGEGSRAVAQQFARWLEELDRGAPLSRTAAWLRELFADVPEAEARVRAWVAALRA